MPLSQTQLDILGLHVQAGDRIAYWETLSSYISRLSAR